MDERHELVDSIVHRYLSLVRHQRTAAHEIKRATGQSGRRIAILRCLMLESPRTVGQISRYLYVSDATVSRILDDMEEHGLVSRRRCTVDSRRVLVEPTAAGRAVAEAAPRGAISTMRELLPTLTVEELTAIDAAMARLSDLVQVDISVMEE